MKSLLISLYEYPSLHDNYSHNQRAVSQQYVPIYPLCDNRAVFAFSQYNQWRTECKLLTFFSFFSLRLFFSLILVLVLAFIRTTIWRGTIKLNSRVRSSKRYWKDVVRCSR